MKTVSWLVAVIAISVLSHCGTPAAAEGTYGDIYVEERPCESGCAETYKSCAGPAKGAPDLACCSSDDHCVRKNDFYSGCFPKTRPIRDDWEGSILTCSNGGGGGGDCPDPKAVDSVWSGYELSDKSLSLAVFDHEDLEDTTCAEECDKLEMCVAFQENEDGGSFCNLYTDDVISLDNIGKASFEPNFDSVLNFVKCYRPPTLCPEDTLEEVDGSNPQLYELVNQDVALVYLTEEFALTDCATICRMHPPVAGDPCVGFARRGANECFPLFDKPGPGSSRKEVDVTADTTVYSISGCL